MKVCVAYRVFCTVLFCSLEIVHIPFLQGVDPDAPEEDEENEVDDAEGDQEEAELLWWTAKF